VKKLFLAAGIAIILIGFIVSYNYGNAITENKTDLLNGEYNIWQISAHYNAGEYIHVYCVPAGNWTNGSWDTDDQVPVNHRHIWFEIVDPYGKITEYNTAWTNQNPSTGEDLSVLAMAMIWVTNQSGAITTGNPQPFIGGIAQVDGNYTVRIPDPLNNFDPGLYQPDPPPPYYLGLRKDYTVTTYPMGYLLPVGMFIGAAGGVISIQSARSKKSTKHNKSNGK
jgi:hypothetical protein